MSTATERPASAPPDGPRYAPGGVRRALPALALWGALLALLSPVLGPEPARAEVIEEIVAKVNNRIITKSEYEERSAAALRQVYRNYFGDEFDRELKTVQDGLLANLITENLLLERAETIFAMDKIRQSLIDDFRKQQNIESDEELERLLAEQGMKRSELEEQLMRMAVPSEIIRYDVRSRISVSDQEARRYYKTHISEWDVPATITFREIVFFYDPDTRAAARARAEEVWSEADGGAPFLDLVARHSEAGTREEGGLLGPLPEADLNPAIATAAFALEPGEISRPIDTGKSLHILRVEEKTPGLVKSLEEVRDTVDNAVRQEKFQPRYQAYLRKLWRESQVDVAPKYEHLLVVSPLKPEQQPD